MKTNSSQNENKELKCKQTAVKNENKELKCKQTAVKTKTMSGNVNKQQSKRKQRVET